VKESRNHESVPTQEIRGAIAARLAASSSCRLPCWQTVSGAATAPPVNPIQLTAPSGLPDTALPFNGVSAATFTATSNFQKLTTSPDAGVTGTPFTVSGTGLTPDTALQLVWGTNTATWSVDAEPYTVNYLGAVYSPTSASSLLNNSNSMYVNLATVTTDASGNFTLKTTAPTDFGGNHDIWAVARASASPMVPSTCCAPSRSHPRAGRSALRSPSPTPRWTPTPTAVGDRSSGTITTPVRSWETGLAALRVSPSARRARSAPTTSRSVTPSVFST